MILVALDWMNQMDISKFGRLNYSIFPASLLHSVSAQPSEAGRQFPCSNQQHLSEGLIDERFIKGLLGISNRLREP